MHRPSPPQWSALDAARAGTARPMLLGLPAELRFSRPPPLAAESDERATGTCRAGWATPCTDLPFSVVVVAGSSGCGLTDDFQARRATSQRRGDLWSKSAVEKWLVFPPVTRKTRAQFPAAEPHARIQANNKAAVIIRPRLRTCTPMFLGLLAELRFSRSGRRPPIRTEGR